MKKPYQLILILLLSILSPMSFATLSQQECKREVLQPLKKLLKTKFHVEENCTKDLIQNFNVLFGDPAFGGSYERKANTSCGKELLKIIDKLGDSGIGRLDPADPCSYEVFDLVHPFFGGTEGGDTGGGY